MVSVVAQLWSGRSGGLRGRAEMRGTRSTAPDLCYLVSHGYAARMVIESGIVPKLRRRGLEVALMGPGTGDEYFLKIAEDQGFSTVPVAASTGRAASMLARFRPYLFESTRTNPVVWSNHLRVVHGLAGGRVDRLLAPALLAFSDAAERSPRLRRSLLALQGKMVRHPGAAEALGRLRPRAVVSTYPIDQGEAGILLEARRLGILTIGHILSWDNITTYPSAWLSVPEEFVGWGPIMEEELRDVLSVPADRIQIAGVPHFDRHLAVAGSDEVGEILKGMGLEPRDPYLFWGMSLPSFAPTEMDVIERLAEMVEKGEVGPRTQLVVRPHPHYLNSTPQGTGWLPRLEALPSRRVAVDTPGIHRGGLPWAMSREDFRRLSLLVTRCAVCLNSGSTLSLEAIAADRPVVLPHFDVGVPRPWWDSVKRCGDFVHQSKMLRLGGVRVVGSFAELGEAIRKYLADPCIDADGRERVRQRELGPCDGGATDRAVEAIESILRKHAPEVPEAPGGGRRRGTGAGDSGKEAEDGR